jgi:uroporphyrinogen-III synthase
MAAEIASEIGDIEGARILLPRGNLASDELPVELRKRGATVTEVVAYRTVRKSDLTKPNPYEPPDAITFTSGEAARASIEFLLASGAGDWLEKCPILCIGPATAKAVIQCGHRVAAVAEKHDSEGLVEALEEWFVGALERQAYAK